MRKSKDASPVSKKSVKAKKATISALAKKHNKSAEIQDVHLDIQRKLKIRKYHSFRLSKPIKNTAPKLSPARRLLKKTLVMLWRNKILFGGVLCIYALAQLLLVRGLIASDFTSLSGIVHEAFGTGWAEFVGGVALYSYLLSSSGQRIPAEGTVYLTLLLIVTSLALIWALRFAHADVKVRVRDAYYRGMHPLIPFILVGLVVLIQMVPFLFGAWLYQTVIVTGIAVNVVEQLFWLIIVSLFALLSFYMTTSSLIGMYIVAIPDMTPMKALRSARELVRHRRLQVFWRILFLLLVSLLGLSVLILPVILYIPAAAPWAFYILSIILLAFIHTYMYSLYRELLNE